MVQRAPLAVRPPSSLGSRLRDGVRGWVSKLLGVGITSYSAGGGGSPTEPPYNVDRTMQALASNPWVYACVQAIATDLSGLPLVVEKGTGNNKTQTSDDPILTLFDYPHPKTTGRRLRRQGLGDFKLAGNSYTRVWRDPAGAPIQLGRCPPQIPKPIVGKDGEPLAWDLDGTRLPWTDILHVADISWQATEALVYGQSPITPLALGLQMDRDSRIQVGRSAKRGRLEMMLTPKDPFTHLPAQSVRDIRNEAVASMLAGDGVYVVSDAMEATALSLSPREGEFLGIRDRTRSEILAVMGVPPVRAGEPAANYGTAKQQMRTYWETLQGIAALFDDEYSRLAPMGTRIRHSFAGVEALQTSQTERQARAAIWVATFGMSPRDAARYEGFIDAPVPEGPAPSDAAPPSETDENGNDPADEPQELSARDQISAVLTFGAVLLEHAEPDDRAGAVLALSAALRVTLIRCGASLPRARAVAKDAADLCASVALSTVDTPLNELGAFAIPHAERVLHNAGLST